MRGLLSAASRRSPLPADLADIQKRIKFSVHRMENAIANHEFEKARFYSDEERKERENMRLLREKYNLDDSSTGCVTKEDIEDVVARWTGVPMTSIKEEEIAKLLRIEDELHKRIVSQEKAISVLARAIRRSRAGLKSANRPAGSFLFLGPTGVGKTEVARALASFLFGSEKKPGALRHVRIHGEARHFQADRIAPRIRGLRGGRTAHRAREAQSILQIGRA